MFSFNILALSGEHFRAGISRKLPFPAHGKRLTEMTKSSFKQRYDDDDNDDVSNVSKCGECLIADLDVTS